MKLNILIKIGGIYHCICAIFHIFFPQMFQWNKILEPLAPENRAVIFINLHIMNWCLFIIWLILAYIPLFHTEEIINTKLGKSVLTSIVLFWIARLFILQPIYTGLNSSESITQALFFMVGLIIFIIPWIQIMFRKK